MQILYLWIENFNSIKEQEFNFGGEYKFGFIRESGELKVKKNDLFISDFFGNKISNVTAIVGENGSGKSTLLNFIKLTLSFSIGNTSLRYLCLFKEDSKSEIFVYNTTLSELLLPDIENVIFKTVERGRYKGDLISLLYPTAFIYYSPIVDFNSDWEICRFDISTKHILERNDNKYPDDKLSFAQMKVDEMKKQLEFIGSHLNKLPFQLPKTLHFNPTSDHLEVFQQSSNTPSEMREHLARCKLMISREKRGARGGGEERFFLIDLFEAFFWYEVKYLQAHITEIIDGFNALDLTNAIDDENTTWGLLKFVFSQQEFRGYLPKWGKVEVFFNHINELVEKGVIYYWGARFNVDLSERRNYELLNQLFNQYKELALVGDFIEFYWEGLSSGEESILALFSRFYGVGDLTGFAENQSQLRVDIHGMTEYRGKPNVVILMDEGETHLHPRWQKNFIHTLTTILPEIIDSENIQLILTSNSPFLISDLPRENVIFMGKGNENSGISNYSQKTFAANINELLANSFFLDSTIGKMAETKIDDVLGLLKSENSLSVDQIDEIRKIIRMIDDSFIQDKLIQLLAIKMGENNWEELMLLEQKRLIDERLLKIKRNYDSDSK